MVSENGFAGSMIVADALKPVSNELFSKSLMPIFKYLEITPSQELLDFLSRGKVVRHLYDVKDTILKFNSMPILQKEAKLVNNLYGFLSLINLSPVSPFEESYYPKDFIVLLENGASTLYSYGKLQFHTLKRYCMSLHDYIQRNGISNIILLESPLGNVVPVSALSKILRLSRISHEIETINTPRNERRACGLTYEDIFINFSRKINGRNANIFYFDDAITGTRLYKNYTILKKIINRMSPDASLYCTAFSFAPLILPYRKLRADPVRIKNKLKIALNNQYSSMPGFTSWVNFPPLPMFKVDDGLPMAYESPVAWGDVDFVAGKKKVNLVFNIIDTLKFILKDLTKTKSDSRILLNKLWSQDAKGTIYINPDEALRDIFIKIDADFSWSDVYKDAKREFPGDYAGESIDIAPSVAVKRYQWIHDKIFEVAKNRFDFQLANLLRMALKELFFFFEKRSAGINTNYDYSHYTIPFNSTIRRFHGKLIELVTG